MRSLRRCVLYQTLPLLYVKSSSSACDIGVEVPAWVLSQIRARCWIRNHALSSGRRTVVLVWREQFLYSFKLALTGWSVAQAVAAWVACQVVPGEGSAYGNRLATRRCKIAL